MKKQIVVGALAVATLGVSSWAVAQPKPEDQMRQRQAAFRLMGWYFGPIGAMMRGDRPFDAAVVQRNAGYLETLSKMPIEGFDPATKDEKPTRALPVIWTELPKFRQNMEAMQGEMAKLAVVAKTGDQAQIRAQFGAVGKTCNACHDAYRAK